MVGGIVIGTVLALMRLSGKKWLVLPAAAYVNTLRSIPLVMVILWFFLLIPFLIGRPMGAELSAIITFTVLRRLLLGDHARRHPERAQGQVYAGYAVGMTYAQCMKLVVLPQAFRQHAAGAADADHHPVPGHLAGLRDRRRHDLLKGLRVAGKNFNRPVETCPRRGGRLLHHLLLAVVLVPAAAEDPDHPLRGRLSP